MDKIVGYINKLSKDKLFEVIIYDQDGTTEKLYTIENNKKFVLGRDGAVFLNTKDVMTKLMKEDNEVLEKPHSHGIELDVLKVNNKLGIYDGNLKMKYGPFKNFDDVQEFVEDKKLIKRINNWDL